MADPVSSVIKAVESAADSAVTDAIAAVKNHPEYAQVVDRLASEALSALLHDVGAA